MYVYPLSRFDGCNLCSFDPPPQIIQKTCLRIILGDMYFSYDSALEMSGLQTLYSRSKKRRLDFALKSNKHPRNKKMFPLNNRTNGHTFTTKEKFIVNGAPQSHIAILSNSSRESVIVLASS